MGGTLKKKLRGRRCGTGRRWACGASRNSGRGRLLPGELQGAIRIADGVAAEVTDTGRSLSGELLRASCSVLSTRSFAHATLFVLPRGLCLCSWTVCNNYLVDRHVATWP